MVESLASRATRYWPLLLALAIVSAVVGFEAWHYRPFLADDSLISLRYARRLLDGRGLTWTDGPRVEGYSNLLWILLVTAAGALGADLVHAARWLGVACSLAAAAAPVFHHARRGAGGLLPALAGGCVVAVAGPIAVWAGAGLEMPLVAALLAWSVVLAALLFGPGPPEPRRAAAPSVLLALLALSRPDGALLGCTIVAALLLHQGPRRETLRTCVALGAPIFVALVAQETFRLVYYHAWVPNPALVKIAFTRHRIESGLYYLNLGWRWLWPLAILVALGATRGLGSGGKRGETALALVPLVVWIGYVIAIGGDFFPGYRFLVPAVVLGSFLAAAAAEGPGPRWLPGSVRDAVVVLLVATFGVLQWRDPENARANREVWAWDGQITGHLLKRAFGETHPLIAVSAAGCVPYWSGFDALDLLGLNDWYLPRHPREDFGQGWVGHELGDAGYVLRRAPDLIQFSGIRHSERVGYFRGERELAATPEFHAHYDLVAFEAREPRLVRQLIWARRDSSRIGIARSEREVRVPAFLFALNPQTSVTLDSAGHAGVEVTRERPAAFGRLDLGPGRWLIECEPDSQGLVVGTRPGGSDGPFAPVPSGGGIALDHAGAIDLLLVAHADGAIHVVSVVLRRAVASR